MGPALGNSAARTVMESAGCRWNMVNGVYVMRRWTMPSPRPQPSGLLNTPMPMSYLHRMKEAKRNDTLWLPAVRFAWQGPRTLAPIAKLFKTLPKVMQSAGMFARSSRIQSA